jgi:flavin-dependent dehydrogenase
VRSSAQSDVRDGERWDVLVVGGGHNALTAAAYLGRAGRRVLVLERAGARWTAFVEQRLCPGACPGPEPEGAQVKVNLLLRRLPALHDPVVPPAAAFAGTSTSTTGSDQDPPAGSVVTRQSGPGKYTDSCPSCQRTR